jgi:hypothetical protein
MIKVVREGFYDWMARNRFTPAALWVIAVCSVMVIVILCFIPWSR